MKIYNGDGIVLGRLAARVAKDALLGEEIHVVNCEKIIISGKKTNTVAHEHQRRERKGYPLKSAKFSRLADKFVRRSIRGMLPWRYTRGKEAFKQVFCYARLPAELAGKEMIHLQESSREKLPSLQYTTVGDVCKQLGAKEYPQK